MVQKLPNSQRRWRYCRNRWIHILLLLLSFVTAVSKENFPQSPGPRFVLQPIKIFASSFCGTTLWENRHFVTPSKVISSFVFTLWNSAFFNPYLHFGFLKTRRLLMVMKKEKHARKRQLKNVKKVRNDAAECEVENVDNNLYAEDTLQVATKLMKKSYRLKRHRSN